jgi:hypothetical protein
VELLPQSGLPPAPEHRVDGLPFREVDRQLSPLAAGADDVQDRVEDVSTVDRRSPALRGLWQERSEKLPLLVCQVAGIIRRAHRYGSVFLDW